MELEKICQEVIAIAKTAGAFIAHERINFDLNLVELKGKANFVSYVDKNAEKIIVESLRKLLPDSGFITEEGTAFDSGEKYRWVIDPLDGTTNFIHGAPTICRQYWIDGKGRNSSWGWFMRLPATNVFMPGKEVKPC